MAAQVALVKSVQASVQPKSTATGRSAKQVAASKKWAAAGRKAQKGKPKTAKQLAASKRNLAKGRAVVAARRAEKRKTASAPSPEDTLISLHQMPVCAATAIAAHLFQATGIEAADAEILALSKSTGPVQIGELLEHIRYAGFCGARLVTAWETDPDLIMPGLICCYQEATGYHAVLSIANGMFSWGAVRRWPRPPEEAWYLEWETA